jgi:hypothetical protein
MSSCFAVTAAGLDTKNHVPELKVMIHCRKIKTKENALINIKPKSMQNPIRYFTKSKKAIQ